MTRSTHHPTPSPSAAGPGWAPYAASTAKDAAEVFARPDPVFRGAPFWSWNDKLDIPRLLRQIDTFKEMGFGGFHMHPRTGLSTPYLGEAFMEAVRACVEKAEREGMQARLYDEDRWPSGSAGGKVTRDPAFRARHLLFTPFPYGRGRAAAHVNDSSARSGRTENGRLLARYAIALDDRSCLITGRRLRGKESCPGHAREWFAYLETAAPSDWFNGQTYVDTLNPKATARFLDVTHESYLRTVGSYFGGVVPSLFTDEPQFCHKTQLAFAEDTRDLILPWTDDFAESFGRICGTDILEALPELFWELPEKRVSVTRYCYHDHLAERFARAYADTVGAWCGRHGLALTGHMMEEPSLLSQTRALGEAMRSYRAFHLPGVDILCDDREYTTLKQAQSAARQYGRPGISSELYGVTNWDFDFRGHKSQGDWQAALGVILRVHHLSWYSMAGEAKRDYPASIAHQSPWWRKYPLVEDHFARLGAVLTRGTPRVRIGVIHPIESYWLAWGPGSQTADIRKDQDEAFRNLTEWLLFQQLDFDFICESLLPGQRAPEPAAPSRFAVGEMAYDAIVVPELRTLRASTLERLEPFARSGGTLVFIGDPPGLVDATPSNRGRELSETAQRARFAATALSEALAAHRDVEVRTRAGEAHPHILYQWRDAGDEQFVFLCDTRREAAALEDPMNGTQDAVSCRVRLRGNWEAARMDTATGTLSEHPAWQTSEWTELHWVFHCHGHLLLRLKPARRNRPSPPSVPPVEASFSALSPVLTGRHPVTLSEPNALLLDVAEWRWEEGPWQARGDILRVDNRMREKAGLPPRVGNVPQPWTRADDLHTPGKGSLRFRVEAAADLEAPRLALEPLPDMEIRWNGERVVHTLEEWWVDEAIRLVSLPRIKAGVHELRIEFTYPGKSGLEACYLLGNFGVELAGTEARLTPPVETLAWGDITRQGLPFYTGNLTYHVEWTWRREQNLALHAPHYRGALIGVQCNGAPRPDIAFAPYESALGCLPAGQTRLDLTLYGNRFNVFGPLHCAGRPWWAGPDSWRTEHEAWCDEYQLRPLGILAAPRLVESQPQP